MLSVTIYLLRLLVTKEKNSLRILTSGDFLDKPYNNRIGHFWIVNGAAHFKNVNNCLNTNIYSYLETAGGQSSNLYLNVIHFFNTTVN
jgi:hypothetical protein